MTYFTPYCVLHTWKHLFYNLEPQPQKENHHWRNGYLSASCIMCGTTYDPEKHNEAFRISPKANIYYCFKCHNGGDASSMVSRKRDMSIMAALSWLKKEKIPELHTCTKCKAEICGDKTCVVARNLPDEACEHTFN